MPPHVMVEGNNRLRRDEVIDLRLDAFRAFAASDERGRYGGVEVPALKDALMLGELVGKSCEASPENAFTISCIEQCLLLATCGKTRFDYGVAIEPEVLRALLPKSEAVFLLPILFSFAGRSGNCRSQRWSSSAIGAGCFELALYLGTTR